MTVAILTCLEQPDSSPVQAFLLPAYNIQFSTPASSSARGMPNVLLAPELVITADSWSVGTTQTVAMLMQHNTQYQVWSKATKGKAYG